MASRGAGGGLAVIQVTTSSNDDESCMNQDIVMKLLALVLVLALILVEVPAL